jgi:hypothetical protein
MNLNRFLISAGCIFLSLWLYCFGGTTATLFYAIVTHNNYYFDILSFYLLPYVLAPFAVAFQIQGCHLNTTNRIIRFRQLITTIFLITFLLLILLDLSAIIFAGFLAFKSPPSGTEWLWVLLPITLCACALMIIQLLAKTHRFV